MREETAVSCKVITAMGEIRIYFGDYFARMTPAQAFELSELLHDAAQVAIQPVEEDDDVR